jgi:hypothetical protein
MPYRARVADGFSKQSAGQLITMAGAVIAGLTDNRAIPAPTVDLKAAKIDTEQQANRHGRSAWGWRTLGRTERNLFASLHLRVFALCCSASAKQLPDKQSPKTNKQFSFDRISSKTNRCPR